MGFPWRQLEARARTGPGSPLITFRDGRGRVELSAATALNGASKIANALEAEGIDEGSTVALHLPWHWQRSLWCAGARAVGATVEPFGLGCDLAVCTPEFARAFGGESLVVSMHPLGLPSADPLPPGCTDAAGLVMAQPDAFVATQDFPEQWPAPGGDAQPGERVLVTCSDSPEGWPWCFEVPMALEISLVMCPPMPNAELRRIAEEERAGRIVVLDPPT